MKRMGVGIIGLSAKGGWAANAHVPALRKLPGYEIRGFCASSVANAKAAAEKFEVPLFFDNPEALAARPEIDLVVVAVKVPRHREMVTAALEAGKTVYCEWPLGANLAEAEELAELAKRRGVRAFIGLQAQAAPAVRYIKDLVRSGYVGEVTSTNIAASSTLWGGTVAPEHLYTLDPTSGTTMLTVSFGHGIDGLCSCLGEFRDLSAVLATLRPQVRRTDTGELVSMNAPDQIAVAGSLQNGAIAAIHYRGGISQGTNFRWEITGTKGELLMIGITGSLQLGNLSIQGANETGVSPLPVPDKYALVSGTPEDISYTLANAYARLLSDLNGGTTLVPTFAHAVARHRMLDTLQRSAVTGRRLTLDQSDMQTEETSIARESRSAINLSEAMQISRTHHAELPRATLIPRFAVIGLVIAGVAGLFLYAGGWLTPHALSPVVMINAFERLNGEHSGFRRNHAKGVCVGGYFESNGRGVALSKAVVFQPGRVPVIGRFALAGGQPYAADTAQTVRSMALLFQLPDGEEWHTGMNNIPVFIANSAQGFYEQLLASAPDPATGKPDPTKMGAFLAKHPESAKAIQLIRSQPATSGFADSTYNSLNAFRFINSQGVVVPVRWAMVPVQSIQPLNQASSRQTGTNELFEALIASIHNRPLKWHLVITVGQPGDSTADATLPWPPDREQVEVGTLTIDHVESEDTSSVRDLNFDPLVLPSGITGSDDPLLSARSAAYSVSFTRREGEHKDPSAVSIAQTRK